MTYQLIGKITGFKGLKGELKVKPMSGFMLERLTPNTTIYIKNNQTYQSLVVKSYHEKQKTPLMVIKDLENINLVQSLKGKEIYIDSNQGLTLPEDTFHQDDLIGLKIYQKHQYKGEVIDIRNYPGDDYLLVRTEEKDVLIPFRDEFIVSMDDTSIEIIEMEGLI